MTYNKIQKEVLDFNPATAEEVGQISQLSTDNKTNIVSAINEHQTKIVTTSHTVNLKADKAYVDQQIATIGTASPKGVYPTLTSLQSAFPSGTTGIYVVTEDGNWYYWNNSAWTVGGVYQSTTIANRSINALMLSRNATRSFDYTQSPFAFNCERIINTTFTIGSLNSSGAEAAHTQRIRSDYFSSDKDFSIKVLDSSYIFILFKYDHNYIFQSSSTHTTDTTFTNTHAYYRVVVSKSVLETVANIEEYANSIVIGVGTNSIINQINENIGEITRANKRLDINGLKDAITPNYTIGSMNAQGAEAVNPQKVRSDYFTPNRNFTVEILDEDYNVVLFTFDEDKEFVSQTFITSGKLRVTPPNNYNYRVVVSKDALETVTNVDAYADAISIVIDGYSKSYENKKILLLGDSITARTDERAWNKYFAEIINPSSVINVAVPSATWCDKVGTVYDGNPVMNGADDNLNNVIGNQVQKIIVNAYPAPDIIIIAAGTNDVNQTVSDNDIESQFYGSDGSNMPLDDVDRKTFAGAIRYAVEKLRALYPNAQIFLCTPLQRANELTSNNYPIIKNKGDIIKRMGLRLSVPVIDSMECGVYGQYAVTGSPTLDHNDGLHLSPIGAKKVGEYNARKIINWFCF
ncbi:SGNH/GDSL hydrolase family protein [Paenibacillus xylaniclasticus]|uniref:SGNH/GDSL hydrolase family protein n=1 Tax=Paenibacillus xylaniclasticus TaxID=588083 RepID=UPI000FD8FBF9|nr:MULTISPECIES: SGNH/GDSL hydrolase family protein [Paenibacillus]GFN32613.1 hypothetical protein PCURB6_28730 [Paenibacillus curdlanolyticus]